ncbi:MAG: hypothetical protein ABS99_04155 [Acetobacteraceae bacterium SCN 69-10]|nr:DUF1194 domain-containing protein [Rhodospirillales bacterium]ODU58749.1 MAG: hypothetical protein ABS99_04155 [Acetobacteraceae bacterium SCN 69-10]OJY68270.1 MAG: hypothetical protein BGP12_11030 [Rhodospirillales bacterium 70-18]
MRWVLACCLVLAVALPPLHGARAADPVALPAVDLALVLVSDVSRSIDPSEFDLQKQGYFAAFTDRRVVAAIQGGALGAIAVSYVEFAAAGDVATVLGWTVIRDAASARAFAERLRAAPRSASGRTSISAGLRQGLAELAALRSEAGRRVIDVCGDGTNNNGEDVAAVRDEAVEGGITINGLAIINDHPVSWNFAHVQPPGGLANYYRAEVTGGPGSFVLEVHAFADFGAAMTRKLISEIAALPHPAGRVALTAAGDGATLPGQIPQQE